MRLMQTFNEGRLRFQFPASWPEVLKYDDGRYYRGTIGRTGAELAAMDFVAAPTTSSLLLLEVKDFRDHEVANRPRLTKGELAAEIMTKAFATLGALYVGSRANHAELRPLAAAVQPWPDTLRVVLLLEKDVPPRPGVAGHLSTRDKLKLESYLELENKLLADLQQKFAPFRIQAAVYSCATVPAREHWTATIVRP